MAILRRCRGSCRNPRRCLEHLWFDVMDQGSRYRMAANDFAIPRMEPSQQRPIQSIEEARHWERLFIGEIHAGRHPRRPRTRRTTTDAAPKNVAALLDAYMERCVKPAGLRSFRSVQSRVSVLKEYLGELPLDALEEPDEINRFKTESDYAEEVEIATVHRALETLRAAMNWGMAQTPPLFRKSPFHRFGVRMNKKLETSRDRRLSREEEKRLLDTALQKMNSSEHQFVGAPLHDRLIGAIELCCRRGEMLMIQNRRVNWETYQIGIPGATTKDKENRRVPFNPDGRLAAILKRRSLLGPDAFLFGSETGAYQPNIQTAWETLKLLAFGYEPKPGREGVLWNRERLHGIDLRWHDLRHEGACRLLADGVDIRIVQLMLGHASIQQTQRYLNVTDEELRRGLEVSWNNKGRPLRLASGA
ncbi:MAG TPA: site-specific integrase [Vicinamibacterales bacterium]|nr:site-specific integrase [Vicinamibacterales bacterium]